MVMINWLNFTQDLHVCDIASVSWYCCSPLKLNYWGSNVSEYSQKQKRMMKIDPMNQLVMTLMKPHINLKTVDLFYRFGILVSATCFKVYNYLDLFHVPSAEGD